MGIKKLVASLVAQKKTSPHIGALINVYTSAAILYTPLTFIGVATTLYGLWGADLLRSWFPWFTFGHLLIVMVCFMLLWMVFVYKVVIPSIYSFQVLMQYRHQNPLVADMQEVLKRLEETNAKLEKTQEELENIKKAINKE